MDRLGQLRRHFRATNVFKAVTPYRRDVSRSYDGPVIRRNVACASTALEGDRCDLHGAIIR